MLLNGTRGFHSQEALYENSYAHGREMKPDKRTVEICETA